MQIKSYRAASVQEALALVRADLGPDAAVLHTREVSGGALKWLGGTRQIEVIATPEAENVPSRSPVEPPLGDRYRSRLSASADQGFDLSKSDEVANAPTSSEDWPQEVAAHFVKMLSSLSPADRQRVTAAIAQQVQRSPHSPSTSKPEA
jgi:flagellar biosynthesis protein FlhF